MRTILLCPAERPAVSFLTQSVPLVLLPVLGAPLISYWMDWLADQKRKDVVVLATDRPELVRGVLADGSKWGLRVQVQSVLHEISPLELTADRLSQLGLDPDPASEVVLVDHLPGEPTGNLFGSYERWVEAVFRWIQLVPKGNRIGLREIQPGIWCGLNARIAANAVLHAPCWLGNQVRIGPQASIGPNAVLEDRVVVDAAAEIRDSIIGPETFVGTLTRVEESIAWGNVLINWRNGSCAHVPDPFLLCALGQGSLAPDQAAVAGWNPERFWAGLIRAWQFLPRVSAKLRQR